MNRPMLPLTLLALTAFALSAPSAWAQPAPPANPYEGVSAPPSDDEIVANGEEPAVAPEVATVALAEPAPAGGVQSAASGDEVWPTGEIKAKSSAAVRSGRAVSQNGAVVSGNTAPATPAQQESAGNDEGMVQGVAAQPNPIRLNRRPAAPGDPDGDMVSPPPALPGQLAAGTTIRVKLLERLSTALSESGQAFRCQVSNDVMQNGKMAIPAGSEIAGTVVRASAGRMGGRGSMRLRPDAVVLPGGARFQLLAELTGAPDSDARVGEENTVMPNSRMKRNAIEYGGAVGGGAVVGAAMAGPAGALTGTLVGFGVVTAHLLVNHPQAVLEEGSTLLFTLTEPMSLVEPERLSAN